MAYKKAIQLVEGDYISGKDAAVGAAHGMVESVTVVDSGVQINFVGGGKCVRPEDELLEIN